MEASKQTSSEEIVCCITDKLGLTNGSGGPYELAEVCLFIWYHCNIFLKLGYLWWTPGFNYELINQVNYYSYNNQWQTGIEIEFNESR